MYFTEELIEHLDKKIQEPLPGRAAQYRMAHVGRAAYELPKKKKREACVTLLMYPVQEQTHLVLIQRVKHEKDRHSGQIGLPGGSVELTDPDLESAALRELEEEVGVDRRKVKIIGKLSPLYISVSNFMVYPYVAYISEKPKFVAQVSEVAAIIEVPLATLTDKQVKKTKSLELPNGMTLKDVPYFEIKGHTVWGATAMMLNEFIELLDQ